MALVIFAFAYIAFNKYQANLNTKNSQLIPSSLQQETLLVSYKINKHVQTKHFVRTPGTWFLAAVCIMESS
jgi:hypothetical protein